MTFEPELIVDENAFSDLRSQCESVLDLQKRLPEFVFRRAFSRYFAIEHANIRRREFPSFLSRLSGNYADESLSYMSLEPSPVDYYYRGLHFFGAASFKPATLIERYFPVMSRQGNVDSFLARGGDVGVFWGSSLHWGIFCDRISWELAIIAVSGDLDLPAMSGFRCLDGSSLPGYMKAQYARDTSVATDFTRKLLANYSFAH